uniref:Uncharacterized protein n=1 Tax=Oryza meridionalis TaxID=40149 RepID=A0A0E0DAH5_9ORYZ
MAADAVATGDYGWEARRRRIRPPLRAPRARTGVDLSRVTAGVDVIGNCGEEARRRRIQPPLLPHAHGVTSTAPSSDFDGYGGAAAAASTTRRRRLYSMQILKAVATGVCGCGIGGQEADSARHYCGRSDDERLRAGGAVVPPPLLRGSRHGVSRSNGKAVRAAATGDCGWEVRRCRIRPPLRPHAHGATSAAASSDSDGYGGAVAATSTTRRRQCPEQASTKI